MKKIFSILAVACMSMNIFATTFIFDADGTQTQTIDGIKVTLSQGKGSNPPTYLDNGYTNLMRLYGQNTIKVTGENLTNIQILFSKTGKAYADVTASTGTYKKGATPTAEKEQSIDTWTGNASSVTFTLGKSGQRHIIKLVVNGEPIVIGGDTNDSTALDSTFTYSEPTAVIVPDTTLYKQKYTFVQNNIRVSCTKGSILNNDSDYYFNCNASEKITFEATKSIKGMVISGYVRKAFSATVDNGTIEYCSPEDNDREGDPVVIVKDINSKSVTISCVKQLRCYAVRLYFDANPTDELDCDDNGGGGEDGEIINLTFDAADAVYETELTELYKKTNYSIYLYNQASPDYPYIALDLFPASKGDLTGTYNSEDGSLGETTWYTYGDSELDRVWLHYDGALAITKNGENYSISGYITCDDNNTYNFTFSGEMPFYLDTEYYEDDDQAIETAYPPLNPAGKMHDLLGRPVNKGYHGIVIQDGKKYLVR
ncbi:MAG: hypothetical protein J5621_03710 [Paludibacteraceae bacterium]|nr:hypothetical protein [Paludibacteraceae bacterium]